MGGKVKTGYFVCAALISVFLALIAGCAPRSDFVGVQKLAEVEVKEYQGEKLDSITDAFDTSIKGTQYVNRTTYRLDVFGLVDRPKKFTYDEVISHDNYEKVVTLSCVEGWDAKILWKGVLLKDLFDDVGVQSGANTVIFYAADGYTTSLPLDYIMDNNIILAYEMNGVELPPSKGFPFQVVAEQKWGYKWAKWVTRIELSDNEEFRGYWEQRGWDHDADLDESPR